MGNVVVPGEVINGSPTSPSPSTSTKGGNAPTGKKKGENKKNKKKNKKNKNKNKQVKASATEWPAYGVDVLRAWVASTDFTSDVSLGPTAVGKASDGIRKLRNVARFMLGALSDFNGTAAAAVAEGAGGRGEEGDGRRGCDLVPFSSLPPLERLLLHRLSSFLRESEREHGEMRLSRAQAALQRFLSSDLSSLFIDVRKDVLYADASDGRRRRAAQTALWLALRSVTIAAAPVLPFTAQDIYTHMVREESERRGEGGEGGEGGSTQQQPCVFHEQWPEPAEEWRDDDLESRWTPVAAIRDECNALLEDARSSGTLGASLEADVVITVLSPSSTPSSSLLASLEEFSDDLPEILLVSRVGVEVELEADGNNDDKTVLREATAEIAVPTAAVSLSPATATVRISVVPAAGKKCRRCWKHTAPAEDQVCGRCEAVLAGQ